MPRGGARVGSGSKPKRVGVLVPIDGGLVGEPGVTPPDDLPADQQEFWRTYAKAAIEARTLTSQTVGAWRLLCEVDARKSEYARTMQKDGLTYIKCVVDGAGNEHQELKKHPLTSEYRQLAQRVETLMGRFGLAPFGKPVAEKPSRKSAAANPWSRIVGQS